MSASANVRSNPSVEGELVVTRLFDAPRDLVFRELRRTP